MKRSQQCIFKLSSSTPKTIRVKYVTWHAILTSTTHLHFTAHAGPSFLNFKPVEATPQNTCHTGTRGNSEHTWAMLCSVTRQALTTRTNTRSACICSCCTPCQLNMLVCLHNKCRSKLILEEMPQSQFHSSWYSQWNRRKVSLGQKISRVSKRGAGSH